MQNNFQLSIINRDVAVTNMFELTKDEKTKVVEYFDHLQPIKYSPYLPKAFTKKGETRINKVNCFTLLELELEILCVA